MDLEECRRKGLIKRARVDTELIKSLIEMSGIKEITVSTARINEVNISAYVSMAYDSLRELLEAICILKGYKVISHMCIGELLKELLERFDYNSFDRMRYIRNGINYYGIKTDFAAGKEIMRKMFAMRKELLETYLKGFY